MRILLGRAAAARVRKLAGRSGQFEKVDPAVRQIVTGVRQGGDRALRKYAERWDGLRPGESLLVSEEEIKASWAVSYTHLTLPTIYSV